MTSSHDKLTGKKAILYFSVIGVLLLILGIAIGVSISSGNSPTSTKRIIPTTTTTTKPVKCTTVSIQNSNLPVVGVLVIPSLSMTAPVTDGVTDNVIAVAVGHNTSTPWPNQPGTSELSAHDVAQFWDLNQLKPGAEVDYYMPCQSETILQVTGSNVVTTNTTVYDLPYTGTILETCWPVNTLAYTNTRLLVDTKVVKTIPSTKQLVIPTYPNAPNVNIPPQLANLGLSLTNNTQPMGEMLTAGNISPALLQTNMPMNFEASALEIWFGMIDSFKYSHPDWFASFSKNVPYPQQFNGERVTGYYKAMVVTISGSGNNVSSMTMQAELGFGIGIYSIIATVTTVKQTVSGSPQNYFYLTGLTMNKV
jgi:sortase A